jgi:hypothetical protein
VAAAFVEVVWGFLEIKNEEAKVTTVPTITNPRVSNVAISPFLLFNI